MGINSDIDKQTPTQVFSCEYYRIFKNGFFIEHLRWLLWLSGYSLATEVDI